MLRRIIGFSVTYPGIVIAVSLAIALAGSYAFYNLPIDVFPDMDAVHAEIVTSDPGLDSYDVEKQITLPLERSLLTVPHLDRLRSLSMFGLSDVILELQGRDELGRRAPRRARLAPGSSAPGGRQLAARAAFDSLGTIYRYTIEAPGLDLIQKRQIQDWVIAPQLQRVPGVAGTSTFGGGGKEYQVNVEPSKLLHYGVTLDQVLAAVSANNANTGGSYITRGDTALDHPQRGSAPEDRGHREHCRRDGQRSARARQATWRTSTAARSRESVTSCSETATTRSRASSSC